MQNPPEKGEIVKNISSLLNLAFLLIYAEYEFHIKNQASCDIWRNTQTVYDKQTV